MALIWIASGDLAEVREAWPEWLSGQRVWHEFVDGEKVVVARASTTT